MTLKHETARQDNFFDVCAECRISCCQNARPPLTARRRRIIMDYVNEHPIEGVEPPLFNSDNGYTFPKEGPDGYCIFNDKKTKVCRIHSVKPETCVAGPITFDINPKTKRLEYYLKMDAICALAGEMRRTHSENDALRKHMMSAKREIRRLVSELEPEDLRAILRIDEPFTVKIAEEDTKAAEKLTPI